MLRAHRPIRRLLALSLVTGVLGGCDGNKAGGENEAKVADSNDEAEKAEAKGETAKPVLARAEPQFDPEQDKALRKQMCDSFTADMVAEHFGVAAADLKQVSIMGCTYAWNDDVTTLEVSVMMPRVHDSLDDAKRWYENATKSKTKEELDAEFEKFEEQLQKSDKLDTKVKKDTAKGLGNLAKSATPDAGVSYEDVAGVGSQARASSADGALWIRAGNLTFQLRAYEGPVKPKVPLDTKNPMAMAKAQIASDKKWVSETVEARRAAAKKIAPDIVAALIETAS